MCGYDIALAILGPSFKDLLSLMTALGHLNQNTTQHLYLAPTLQTRAHNPE
jgi:hypothetical protein